MSQLEPISGFFEENGLELERYPQQSDDPTLQAWEAADEYLLQSFDLSQAEGRPVIVFNDAFGALACALHGQQLYSVSDSYVSPVSYTHLTLPTKA